LAVTTTALFSHSKNELQNNVIEDKNVVSLSVLYATPQGREQQDRVITNIQNAEAV